MKKRVILAVIITFVVTAFLTSYVTYLAQARRFTVSLSKSKADEGDSGTTERARRNPPGPSDTTVVEGYYDWVAWTFSVLTQSPLNDSYLEGAGFRKPSQKQ